MDKRERGMRCCAAVVGPLFGADGAAVVVGERLELHLQTQDFAVVVAVVYMFLSPG